jgi:hypothetical protein
MSDMTSYLEIIDCLIDCLANGPEPDEIVAIQASSVLPAWVADRLEAMWNFTSNSGGLSTSHNSPPEVVTEYSNVLLASRSV